MILFWSEVRQNIKVSHLKSLSRIAVMLHSPGFHFQFDQLIILFLSFDDSYSLLQSLSLLYYLITLHRYNVSEIQSSLIILTHLIVTWWLIDVTVPFIRNRNSDIPAINQISAPANSSRGSEYTFVLGNLNTLYLY